MVQSQRSELVYLVRGTSNGQRMWTYLLVEPLKLPVFKGRLSNPNGSMNLEEFGRILYSGWGENPPAAIKEQIARDYGE